MSVSAADQAAKIGWYAQFIPDRDVAPESGEFGAWSHRDGFVAALDALAAQLAEAEHRAEGWVQHDTEAYAAATRRAQAALAACEAERDALREALRGVVEYFDCLQPDLCGGLIGTCRVCSARAALSTCQGTSRLRRRP